MLGSSAIGVAGLAGDYPPTIPGISIGGLLEFDWTSGDITFSTNMGTWTRGANEWKHAVVKNSVFYTAFGSWSSTNPRSVVVPYTGISLVGNWQIAVMARRGYGNASDGTGSGESVYVLSNTCVIT